MKQDKKAVSGAGIERRKSFMRQGSFSGSIKKLHDDGAKKQGGLQKLGSPFAVEEETSQASQAAGSQTLFRRPNAAQLLAGVK